MKEAKMTRLHTRPSGLRHWAISGVHTTDEWFRQHKAELKADGLPLSSHGLACHECGAGASHPCKNTKTHEQYPEHTVHFSRTLGEDR